MAHVVGVPRRDPCRKCKLPVFLAERLTVGKKVYHRTCLKCARCHSQLSPGSFYETEIDDEYCCETCPDEEMEQPVVASQADEAGGAGAVVDFEPSTSSDTDDVTLRSVQVCHGSVSEVGVTASVKPQPVRASIAARLAFFEQNKNDASGEIIIPPTPPTKKRIEITSDAKLLQKSVSDEEKSQSLKRMEISSSAYKFKFLDTEDPTSSVGNEFTQNIKVVESDSDDGALVTQVPELPKTQPPSALTGDELTTIDLKIVEPEDEKQPEQPETPKQQTFTAKAKVQLMYPHPRKGTDNEKKQDATSEKIPQQITKIQKVLLAPAATTKRKAELQLQLETGKSQTTGSDPTNNNNNKHDISNLESHEEMQGLSVKKQEKPDVDDVKLDMQSRIEPTDNDNDNCLTKEEILETHAQKTSPEDVVEEAGDIVAPEVKTDVKEETTKTYAESNSPVVQETSAFAFTENESVQLRKEPEAATGSSTLSLPPSREDIETTKRLSVVRARLHQFEVNSNDIVSESNKGDSIKSDDEVNTRNSSKKLSFNEGAVDVVGSVEIVEENELKINESDNDEEIEKEENQKHVPKNENNVEPVKEIIQNAVESETAFMQIENETDKNELDFGGKESGVMITTKEPQVKIESNTQEQNHAEQLCGPVLTTSTPMKPVKEYPDELNPFKSDDDDDDAGVKSETENINIRPSSIANSNTKRSLLHLEKNERNLNPFDSSDDEIELLKSGKSSAATTPSGGGKVPPPRPPPPRLSRNPFGDNESIDDQNNFSRRSSLTSSVMRRTPVPTPRNNLSLSQNPTPEPTPRLGSKSQTPTSSTSPALQNASDYYGSANSLSVTPQHIAAFYRNSDIRGSSNSLASSAGGTIRSRKQRRAPAPPSRPTVKELFPSNDPENVSVNNNNNNNNSSNITVSNNNNISATTNNNSQASTPGSSTVGTPKQGRKKRPAPAPPKPARHDATIQLNVLAVQKQTALTSSQQTPTQQDLQQQQQHEYRKSLLSLPKNSFSYPLQSESDSKLSDEEKALLEGKSQKQGEDQHKSLPAIEDHRVEDRSSKRDCEAQSAGGDYVSHRKPLRLIPLDASLLQDDDDLGGGGCGKCDDIKRKEHEEEELNIVYRRVLMAPQIATPTHDDSNSLLDELNLNDSHNRQLEKLKDNKEAQNRNRQSQTSLFSSGTDESESFYASNKSSHGKWKRRKGPAPALPIPPRKVLQMLPLQEIKHELEIIEVQQQGLEKQGVILEKMIRDRCEDANGDPLSIVAGEGSGDGGPGEGRVNAVAENSKEVEDLILQLFELVNEKNELFRRQAELMYLRRQHRLEQEQADIEYEIRVLMAQPERNKTDSDKAREEALIARLVEVVQLRNEVIDSLEMDRLREAEEDLSIKKRLELHSAQRGLESGEDKGNKTTPTPPSTKLSKKEKKKQKETKKLVKSKKLDLDKDADETELNVGKSLAQTQIQKKKKKKFLF